jgi:hypothetical protein
MKLKNFSQSIIKLILFSIIFFFTPPVFARSLDPIGKVIALRGNIMAVSPDSSSRKLTMKGPVFLKDTIITKNGRIQLAFKDNTLITLGRNSEMEITKYSWEPGDKNSAMETNVKEGTFRIMAGAITRIAPDNFKTNAPSGTIGIRGSMYAGMVKGPILKVVFQGGKGIYVKNAAGIVNISRPGFGTTVKGLAQLPEKPGKMAPKELIELERNLAAGHEKPPAHLSDGSEPPPRHSGDTSPPPSKDSQLVERKFADSRPLAPGPETTGPVRPPPPGDISLLNNPPPNLNETIINASQMNPGLPPATGPDLPPATEPEVPPATEPEVPPATEPEVPPATEPEVPLTTEQTKIQDLLLQMGFSEPVSTSIPSNGIWKYTGEIINTLLVEPSESINFIINWDNRRIMLLEDIPATPNDISNGFGFGTISSTGAITNIKILGSDNSGGGADIMALTGSETFGQIYGATHGGVGIAIQGYDINLQNASDQEFWSDITAGTVPDKTSNPYSGTEIWKGFFIGVAEDMASPNTKQRAFYNTNPDDFPMTLNMDTGTISGSMSGSNYYDGTNTIATTFGGNTNNSVFISHDLMAASINSGTINMNGPTIELKSYGNFMVTSDKRQLSSHTTWGHWEAAYFEPVTEKDYHIHIPGAMWITGKQTPAAAINNHIANSFIGGYTGIAEGVEIDSFGTMTTLKNGMTTLMIEFDSMSTMPVTGSLGFDQVTLSITSNPGAITTSGFSANIDYTSTNKVNGAFYGPNAESIGGNFSADVAGKKYHGIFGGDR